MPFTIKSGEDSITVDTAEEAVALSDAFWRETMRMTSGTEEIQSGELLASVLKCDSDHRRINESKWETDGSLTLRVTLNMQRQEQLRGLAIALRIAQPTPLGTVFINNELGMALTDALVRIAELESALPPQTLAELDEARQLAESPGSAP